MASALPVNITDEPTLVSTGLGNGMSIAVHIPPDGTTVYFGGSDVTVGDGFPIYPGDDLPMFLKARETLYGVVASGSQDVRVLRAGEAD